MQHARLSTVLQRYPGLGAVVDIVPFTSGLSRAQVWRVITAAGQYALRCEPRAPVERDFWRVAVLNAVRGSGLPAPQPSGFFESLQADRRGFWLLTDWINGEPLLTAQPSAVLLSAAAASLARVHLRLQAVRLPEQSDYYARLPRVVRPPGIRLREAQLYRSLLSIDQWTYRIRCTPLKPVIADFAVTTLERLQKFGPALLKLLNDTEYCQTQVFPCLRDVRPEHVLFLDGAVTGILDPWAMRPDCAAADLSRLTADWRFSNPDWYSAALEAYHEIRPLEELERRFLDLYDQAGRLLACVNWVQWTAIEPVKFKNLTAVERRLSECDAACVAIGW